MKHNVKITIILILMFFIAQLVGLFIIHVYNNGLDLPYGMQPPADIDPNSSIFSILIAFPIAIALFFVLTKFKAAHIIKFWFFFVVILALGIAFNSILFKLHILYYTSIIALIIAVPLAFFKIFKRDLIVHNLTELLIYPGIAAVFVPLLNVLGIIILLLIISAYDIWAVWRSQFMQKMAQYQMDTLKIFTGFFIPYANKKEKTKIKNLKEKYKNKSDKFIQKQFEKAKVKVNLAILGGGDIIFPIITAGVFYKIYGSIFSALIIAVFATLALLWLFVFAKKGKFYPAMPFLTIGIYIGMIVNWIFLALHWI